MKLINVLFKSTELYIKYKVGIQFLLLLLFVTIIIAIIITVIVIIFELLTLRKTRAKPEEINKGNE